MLEWTVIQTQDTIDLKNCKKKRKNKQKQTNKQTKQFGLVYAIIFPKQNPVITELLNTSR
jgi:hypothetical protein